MLSLSKLIEPFSIEDIRKLLESLKSINLTNSDISVLKEVVKESSEELQGAQNVLKKINVTNLPLIVENLNLLGIQLTDFITNPGIFFEFLGDPEKSAILVELQSFLPRY